MLINRSIAVNVTIGFTPGAESILNRLIDTMSGNLSPEDQQALSNLTTLAKSLRDKADHAAGKPVTQ